MESVSDHPEPDILKDAPDGAPSGNTWYEVLFTRLLIGFIVLICAEVFSGSSLPQGLWHPWTILITYWLYFAHFFFFTTLAVRTGRTSLSSLYLWGVLFGLYESWITKVIWYGYQSDGGFVMGNIGPYGFAEINLVFFFHPLVSFILPLAVTCLLCPPLKRLFPELAWLTGKSKGARIVLVYLVFCFAPIMAMNSAGPINLAANLAVAVFILLGLLRLARPALASSDGRPIVVFGRWGFGVLCVYLAFLYGVTYFHLYPERLPSVPVQLFTFVFYGIAIAGLWLHRRREPLAGTTAPPENGELRLVAILFAVLLAVALALSVFARGPALYIIIAVNFVIWTVSGCELTALSFTRGVEEVSGRTHAQRKTPTAAPEE